VGVVIANSMMGEVTPTMAEAVASSGARKILLPLIQENVEIVGTAGIPLPHLIDELIEKNLNDVTL
jgi:hypothetical protein